MLELMKAIHDYPGSFAGLAFTFLVGLYIIGLTISDIFRGKS